MILSIEDQLEIFISVFAAGVVAGIFYDLIRILRLNIKHSHMAVCVEDIIYWIVVIIVMFLFMLDKNNADLRFFSIMGFYLGLVIYNILMSNILMEVLEFCVNIIKNIIKIIIEMILTPFKLIWMIIGKPVKKAASKTDRYLKKGLQLGKVCVKINKKRIADQMRFIARRKK